MHDAAELHGEQRPPVPIIEDVMHVPVAVLQVCPVGQPVVVQLVGGTPVPG